MKPFIINMKSMTQAQKARAFLLRNGINSAIIRTSGANGCGVALKIWGRRAEVCALLKKIGVSCDLP